MNGPADLQSEPIMVESQTQDFERRAIRSLVNVTAVSTNMNFIR